MRPLRELRRNKRSGLPASVAALTVATNSLRASNKATFEPPVM